MSITPENITEAGARIRAALPRWTLAFEREADELLRDPTTQTFVERELREIWRQIDPKGSVPTAQRERIFSNAKAKAANGSDGVNGHNSSQRAPEGNGAGPVTIDDRVARQAGHAAIIPPERRDTLRIFDWKNEVNGDGEHKEAPKTDEARASTTAAADAGSANTGTAAPTVPVTLNEWLSRDLPEPDRLLGQWLTTTTRAIFNAPTGAGKSMFANALGMSVAAGCDFLGWKGIRRARVLYIDGEMSRRLLKQRLADEVTRLEQQLAERPDGFYPFSREDYANFAPLNTKEGQAFIENYMKQKIEMVGNLDFIIFDNVMSLILGDMKDEESWRQTMPLVHRLTARGIGQLWIHHTGYNESHGYGTKTREWQMDSVLNAVPVERPDTDVSFKLSFSKARERTPATRADFAESQIALVNNAWTWESSERESAKKISPVAVKYLDALRDAIIGSNVVRMNGYPTATIDAWRTECIKKSLIEVADEKDKVGTNRASAKFSKYKLELISANRIACNETLAWTIV
jgi:hypothetical protein